MVFACTGFLHSLAVATLLFVVLFVTFDGLERGMGDVLELLACGVGGVTLSSMLQGGLNVGIGVH